MECNDAQLSLTLVDDEEIARLNNKYLDRDGPTNVISFPMQEGAIGEINSDLLGDVVISVETTKADADIYGYTFEEMLDFYLIHGILHLIGYDHVGSSADEEQMEAKSRQVWQMLGY